MKYFDLAIVIILVMGGCLVMGAINAEIFGGFGIVTSLIICIAITNPIFNVLQAYWESRA